MTQISIQNERNDFAWSIVWEGLADSFYAHCFQWGEKTIVQIDGFRVPICLLPKGTLTMEYLD